MAQHPRLDITVAYGSLQGVEPDVDLEFGVEVAWDIPLLEGYPWVHMPTWCHAAHSSCPLRRRTRSPKQCHHGVTKDDVGPLRQAGEGHHLEESLCVLWGQPAQRRIRTGWGTSCALLHPPS